MLKYRDFLLNSECLISLAFQFHVDIIKVLILTVIAYLLPFTFFLSSLAHVLAAGQHAAEFAIQHLHYHFLRFAGSNSSPQTLQLLNYSVYSSSISIKRYRLTLVPKEIFSLIFPRQSGPKWRKSQERITRHRVWFASLPYLPYLFSLFLYNRSTILAQIMKIAIKLNNVDRFQNILKIFKQQGTQLPHHQLHKFVGRVDRTLMKAQPYFKPLQEMMQELTPRVVADKFIAKNPFLMGSTAFIYCNLNLSSNLWMDHCSKTVEQMLARAIYFDIADLEKIYRSFVELNDKNNEGFLKLIRAQIKNRLVEQLHQIEIKELYKDQQYLSKRFQFLHKYIRPFLLDQQADIKILDEVFERLDRILKKEKLNIEKIDKRHHFGNCAADFELMQAFKINIPQTHYGSLLEKLNKRLKKMKNRDTGTNSDTQFQMRGESVFELRFMKHMHTNGYWFDRNISIGIHQFDVLLKGKLKHRYYPFAGVNIEKLQKGEFRPITQDEIKVYEKSNGIWYLEQPCELKESIIINLNGPYHYLTGDQTGLSRSQAVKPKIAEFYGYKDVRIVDYRKWQAQTTNNTNTTLFLEKLIGF